MSALVIDSEREHALALMESGRNIFLTGKAGTGKSSLIKYFFEHTKRSVLRLGSTGIAAINIGGQTIHSALRIMPRMHATEMKKETGPWAEIFRHVDALAIDEISMVRADLLDTMDAFLRLNGRDPKSPFGGIQLIGIGDLCQLPPVVTEEEQGEFASEYTGPYFFDAKCFPSLNMQCVELKRVFRQSDLEFIRVLNLIRTGGATRDDLAILNARYVSKFRSEEFPNHVYVAGYNKKVDELNTVRLAGLTGKHIEYTSSTIGKFPRDRPAEEVLVLKVGARVMLLNNDKERRWVNGDVGVVRAMGPAHVEVELPRVGTVPVVRHAWENNRQRYDERSKTLMREVVGAYSQIPLRLAWAITIHKSQGQTFNNVAIDLTGGTFAHGQAYVALSRATSLTGLVLAKKLTPRDIKFDERVRAFIQKT